MSSGRPLKVIDQEVLLRTARQMSEEDAESARLHLESVKRVLARTESDFVD